ncbi:MAG: L-histidine N(alpha)-methyltransferase, partial [Methyloceanibacter sp.]
MEDDISLQFPTGPAASSRSLRAEAPASGEFAEAVLAGLSRTPRSGPCRFFYDARGSELFEEITKLEEYYPTRVETALLEANGEEIAA